MFISMIMKFMVFFQINSFEKEMPGMLKLMKTNPGKVRSPGESAECMS